MRDVLIKSQINGYWQPFTGTARPLSLEQASIVQFRHLHDLNVTTDITVHLTSVLFGMKQCNTDSN